MKRKDLPFQDWGRKAIAEGRKTLTSRCSGLAAVNKQPDRWELHGQNVHGEWIFFAKDDRDDGAELCSCPWQVGIDYNGVTVTAITAKRVQDMTETDAICEGMLFLGGMADNYDEAPWADPGDPKQFAWRWARGAFRSCWDRIHRRDVNNRYERNPWTWRLTIKRTEQPQ